MGVVTSPRVQMERSQGRQSCLVLALALFGANRQCVLLQARCTFLSTWLVRHAPLHPEKGVSSVARTPRGADISTTGLMGVVTSPREQMERSQGQQSCLVLA